MFFSFILPFKLYFIKKKLKKNILFNKLYQVTTSIDIYNIFNNYKIRYVFK